MNTNTVIPDEFLTKERLVDMLKEDIDKAGSRVRFVRIICLGMIGVFCVIPMIVFFTTGINWNNFILFAVSSVSFGIIGFLVYKIPKKLMAKDVDKHLQAVREGHFRLWSDIVVRKKSCIFRDKHGHVVGQEYYVRCENNQSGHIYCRMRESWWKLVCEGDPVYILEIQDEDGNYVPYEAFPSKQFLLDAELESYLCMSNNIL